MWCFASVYTHTCTHTHTEFEKQFSQKTPSSSRQHRKAFRSCYCPILQSFTSRLSPQQCSGKAILCSRLTVVLLHIAMPLQVLITSLRWNVSLYLTSYYQTRSNPESLPQSFLTPSSTWDDSLLWDATISLLFHGSIWTGVVCFFY